MPCPVPRYSLPLSHAVADKYRPTRAQYRTQQEYMSQYCEHAILVAQYRASRSKSEVPAYACAMLCPVPRQRVLRVVCSVCHVRYEGSGCHVRCADRVCDVCYAT
eukprot:2359148-Rhodomonas_salina.2